jgi:PKD repeat protein
MLNGEDAHSLATIPNTNGGIYYCSGRTVFYRNNALTEWQIFNDSLPAYFNSDIAHPFFRDGKLRIASYGKGIWESPLYEQPSSPVAQITVDKLQQTVVCVADSFYFDDYSVLNHTGASWQWTFQGGNPATSNLRNPHVYFSSPGTYLATLTVTDGSGHTTGDPCM